MKNITAGEICDFLDGEGTKYEFQGNRNAVIHDFSNLQELTEAVICWVKDKKYLSEELIERFRSLKDILIVSPFRFDGVNCIMTDYPKGVFFSILNHFFAAQFPHTISKRATVLTKAIGKNVHIGANCYVGPEVSIGDNSILHPNVVIDCPCKIGKNCEIFAGVVIGSDGFGYYKDDDGVPHREIHYKGVVIGDNVEIGANACIDRGLLSDTVIEDDVKIDSLCYISHNVHIERNCLIIGGSIICGSAYIGHDSYLSPNSMVFNQVKVGIKAKIGAGSIAMWKVEPGATIFGNPGQKIWQEEIIKGEND